LLDFRECHPACRLRPRRLADLPALPRRERGAARLDQRCGADAVTEAAPDPFAGRDASPFGRRQRRPRGARLPVTVVTGFLGAGKTTLVRELLTKPEGANTAVIVNEFGEIGIDDALLRASSDATVLLGNGCLCCAIRTDLQETL